MCALILLYMCPHTPLCVRVLLYVSAYYHICVLILLHICVLILLYICPHTPLCVSIGVNLLEASCAKLALGNERQCEGGIDALAQLCCDMAPALVLLRHIELLGVLLSLSLSLSLSLFLSLDSRAAPTY